MGGGVNVNVRGKSSYMGGTVGVNVRGKSSVGLR